MPHFLENEENRVSFTRFMFDTIKKHFPGSEKIFTDEYITKYINNEDVKKKTDAYANVKSPNEEYSAKFNEELYTYLLNKKTLKTI